MAREGNIIQRAVSEFGYKRDYSAPFANTVRGAERILCSNIECDRYEYCRLEAHGLNQHFRYDDGKGFVTDIVGEIYDPYNHDKDKHQVIRVADMAKVDWKDIAKGAYGTKTYAFVFARVVDSNAKVVALYDYL